MSPMWFMNEYNKEFLFVEFGIGHSQKNTLQKINTPPLKNSIKQFLEKVFTAPYMVQIFY